MPRFLLLTKRSQESLFGVYGPLLNAINTSYHMRHGDAENGGHEITRHGKCAHSQGSKCGNVRKAEYGKSRRGKYIGPCNRPAVNLSDHN